MVELITQAELARRMKVSKAMVNKWKKQGRLVFKGKKIDFKATKKILANTADPARKPQKKSKSKEASFLAARTAKEMGRAAIVHLDLKERQGELVNAQEISAEIITANMAVKNRLRSIASFIHLDIARIYGITNTKKQREVSILIAKAIDEALEELCQWTPEK